MIFVMGWLELEAGGIDLLHDAAVAMVSATTAEQGCIFYNFAADIVSPDVIRISECWTDDTALSAHGKTTHMSTFNAELGKVGIISADVRVYAGEEIRQLIRK